MQPELQQVLDFVEGRMSAEQFERALMENPKFEELLSTSRVKFSAQNVDTTTYLYVVGLQLKNIGNALNAHHVLKKHLDAVGISYKPTELYSETYDLFITSQPKWIECGDDELFRQQILPFATASSKAEKKLQLRNRFLVLFRYAKNPPEWIQGGAWPIEDGKPLYFLGQVQVDAPELFHDIGAAYLFINQSTRETKVVIQLF